MILFSFNQLKFKYRPAWSITKIYYWQITDNWVSSIDPGIYSEVLLKTQDPTVSVWKTLIFTSMCINFHATSELWLLTFFLREDLFVFILCSWVFCLNECLCTCVHLPVEARRWRASDLLELELQLATMWPWNQTPIFRKNNNWANSPAPLWILTFQLNFKSLHCLAVDICQAFSWLKWLDLAIISYNVSTHFKNIISSRNFKISSCA